MATTRITALEGVVANAFDTVEMVLAEPMRPRSEIIIGGSLHIQLSGLVPNRFHRWMHRVFFGFMWKAL